jgi:hypothetical protein
MKLTWAIVASLAAIGTTYANPVGTLGIGSGSGINATATSIDWLLDPNALFCPGGCNGDVTATSNLTFDGGALVTSEGVVINNKQAFGTPPPAGAGVFNPFLQFPNNPALTFTLTGVEAGSTNHDCSTATSSIGCSIVVNGITSPVVLFRSGPSGSFVTISMSGFATDATGPSDWTGGFSATIPNRTPLQIAQFFCGADQNCTAAEALASPTLPITTNSGSFTASFTPSGVPEPGTISLFLGGVALLGLGGWKRKSSRIVR